MLHSNNSPFDAAPSAEDSARGPMTADLGAQSTRQAIEPALEKIAIITHELRNSLSVIRNAARQLNVVPSLDGTRAIIERHVGHIDRHIEELLAPPARGMNGFGPRFSHIDLRTIVRYATDAIAPELARRRHRLTVKLPESPMWAHADGALLEQMLSNLLINAARYTPDGGEIAVILEPETQHVRLKIRDSGVGIETSMLPRVFDLFVRVGTPRTDREDGHGIGLAVVRDIAEQHGGTVTATSRGLGHGSEFCVVLPTRHAPHESLLARV